MTKIEQKPCKQHPHPPKFVQNSPQKHHNTPAAVRTPNPHSYCRNWSPARKQGQRSDPKGAPAGEGDRAASGASKTGRTSGKGGTK